MLEVVSRTRSMAMMAEGAGSAAAYAGSPPGSAGGARGGRSVGGNVGGSDGGSEPGVVVGGSRALLLLLLASYWVASVPPGSSTQPLRANCHVGCGTKAAGSTDESLSTPSWCTSSRRERGSSWMTT